MSVASFGDKKRVVGEGGEAEIAQHPRRFGNTLSRFALVMSHGERWRDVGHQERHSWRSFLRD